GKTGEHLSDEHRLCKELLDLAGPVDGDAVLFGKLVDTENCDDVLELLVALEHFLDTPGDCVVTVTNNLGRKDRRRRGQRVHSRVDTEGRNVTAQFGRTVEVGEGGERRRV